MKHKVWQKIIIYNMIKKDKKITLNIKFLLSFYHKNDKHKKTKPKKKTRKNNYISKR